MSRFSPFVYWEKRDIKICCCCAKVSGLSRASFQRGVRGQPPPSCWPDMYQAMKEKWGLCSLAFICKGALLRVGRGHKLFFPSFSLCGCHAPTSAAVTVPKSTQCHLDEDEMNPCRVQEALAVCNYIWWDSWGEVLASDALTRYWHNTFSAWRVHNFQASRSRLQQSETKLLKTSWKRTWQKWSRPSLVTGQWCLCHLVLSRDQTVLCSSFSPKMCPSHRAVLVAVSHDRQFNIQNSDIQK